MSLDNLGNKQTIILHNCETNNEKYDLVTTPHTVNRIYQNKTTNNHNKNFKQTKTDYRKKIFKTKKRCLRIRNR